MNIEAIAIIDPYPVNITVLSVPNSAQGVSDGELHITATDGNGPYSYSINDSAYFEPPPLGLGVHTYTDPGHFTGLPEDSILVTKTVFGCHGKGRSPHH